MLSNRKRTRHCSWGAIFSLRNISQEGIKIQIFKQFIVFVQEVFQLYLQKWRLFSNWKKAPRNASLGVKISEKAVKNQFEPIWIAKKVISLSQIYSSSNRGYTRLTSYHFWDTQDAEQRWHISIDKVNEMADRKNIKKLWQKNRNFHKFNFQNNSGFQVTQNFFVLMQRANPKNGIFFWGKELSNSSGEKVFDFGTENQPLNFWILSLLRRPKEWTELMILASDDLLHVGCWEFREFRPDTLIDENERAILDKIEYELRIFSTRSSLGFSSYCDLNTIDKIWNFIAVYFF